MSRALGGHTCRLRDARRPLAWLTPLALGVLLGGLAGCRREAPAPPPPAVAPAPRVLFAGCALVAQGPVCELSGERTLRLWVEVAEETPLVVRAPVVSAPVVSEDSSPPVVSEDSSPVPVKVSEDSVKVSSVKVSEDSEGSSPAEVSEDSLRAGGEPLKVDVWTVRGGRALMVRVPQGAREVAVEVHTPEGTGTWRLPVREAVVVPLLGQALALKAEGHAPQAEALLREGLESLSPEARARATGLLARLRQAQGDVAGASALLREALGLHRAAGLRSEEVRDGLMLAFLLLNHGRHFSEARGVLEGLKPLEEEYPEGAALWPYYAMLLADESGDVRAALRHLALTEARAERLGLERHLRGVRLVKATLLQRLGRGAEALALLEALRAGLREDSAPCERAELLTNTGWVLLEAQEDGEARGEPLPVLEEALALYRGACARPQSEANVLLNLALADLRRGQPAQAEARLAQARRALPQPEARLALWALEVEGRVHLEAGRARQALGLYGRLAQRAEAALSPEARWRAALGRGRALERLGRQREALAAYAWAEALLEDEALRVPVAEGRHGFLGERERSSRAFVALALKAGRTSEALAVARRARARVLESVRLADRVASLSPEARARWEAALSAWRELRGALEDEARQDWRLSAERLAQVRQARRQREGRLKELLDEALRVLEPVRAAAPRLAEAPQPAPGELRLVYFPVAGGWVGFASHARGLVARELGPLPPGASPEVLATTLLGPFRARLEAAERLTFIAHGALRAVDFHALPWGGDVLVASRPVAYALDVPRPQPEAASEALPRGGRTALVVADPQGNLPSAREEARRVGAALRASEGWRVRVWQGPEAHAPALREALQEAALFHYAGHGRFEGVGGWESALPLSEGQLGVGDVLALRRVPPWVVLSGCETARVEQHSPVESMGLAQAFLAAGAHAVVASWREVDDAQAMRLMGTLYRHAPRAEPSRLPEALRRAQLEVRAEHPGSDWAAFRALVP